MKTPGRLRALLLALVVVSLLWGVIATWTAVQRLSAANQVVAGSGQLSGYAQQLYYSLADADATQANAYLSGIEPASDVERIRGDINQAAIDVQAIGAADSDPVIQADLTTLTTGISAYTGTIGEADAFNRDGLPVGASYLREASGLMRGTLLPAASRVYKSENARLKAGYAQATGFPFLAVAAAVLAGLCAIAVQYRLARRTNRVLNPGLVAATLIGLLSLAWLLGSLASEGSGLLAGQDRGSAPAQALTQADVTALQMRSDESLTLINQDGADDSTEKDFQELWPRLQGQLASAESAGAHSPGHAQARAAVTDANEWYHQHQQVYSANSDGDYTTAVRRATGSSTTSFQSLEAALTNGIKADQATAADSAASGDDALNGLVAGMLVAALLMAATGTWGVYNRLAEYR